MSSNHKQDHFQEEEEPGGAHRNQTAQEQITPKKKKTWEHPKGSRQCKSTRLQTRTTTGAHLDKHCAQGRKENGTKGVSPESQMRKTTIMETDKTSNYQKEEQAIWWRCQNSNTAQRRKRNVINMSNPRSPTTRTTTPSPPTSKRQCRPGKSGANPEPTPTPTTINQHQQERIPASRATIP